MSKVLNISPHRSFGFSALSFDEWTRYYSRFALLALNPALQGPEGTLGQKVGMDKRGPEKAETQRLGLVSTPAMVGPQWWWNCRRRRAKLFVPELADIGSKARHQQVNL